MVALIGGRERKKEVVINMANLAYPWYSKIDFGFFLVKKRKWAWKGR
jgi:hypothetical protein